MGSRPLDKPPEPSLIDLRIHQHNGSTFAVDTLPASIQASKNQPTPSLKKMIEILSRDIGRLRVELSHKQNLQRIEEQYVTEAQSKISDLEMIDYNFRQRRKEIEKEYQNLVATLLDE